MNMHRHHAVAALASAVLIATGVAAGCTSAFDSAQPSAELASQGTDLVGGEAGDGIRALVQSVNWAQLETAAVVEGF